MVLVWLLWCTFCAMLVEAILGNHGLLVPVLASTCFYFTVVLGWRTALVPAILVGSVLDMVLGRPIPTFFFLLPNVTLLALFWRRYGDCRRRSIQAVPGALLGGAMGLGAFILVRVPNASLGGGLLLEGIWVVVRFTVGGMLALPVVGAVLDRASSKLALPCYHSVQEQE